MIFLGLVIAVAAAGVGVAVVLDNFGSAKLTLFDQTIPGITSQWHVFLAGAIVTAVFMSGMIVAMLGVGRALRVRRELRDLRDEHEESLTTLEMEKRQLQRELARARQAGRTMAPAERRPGGPSATVPSSPFFDSAG